MQIKPRRTYPITLMQDDGLTVRFTEQNTGTVVKGSLLYKVGFTSDRWINSQDQYIWQEVK